MKDTSTKQATGHEREGPPSSGGCRGAGRADALAVLVLCLLAAGVFADVLFASANHILSREGTDLWAQFIHLRRFVFGRLRTGDLPLWNPYLFGGASCIGGFQSAMFYPPNWLFCVLPTALAVNLGIFLHVLAAGIVMYWWMRLRNMHPMSATFAGVLTMFCGSHFMHIYAGHLTNLCAMPWTVLILLVTDRLVCVQRNSRVAVRWGLVGAIAVALQIFAGHPQYVFYTGIAACLLLAARLFETRRWLGAAIPAFAGMYLAGALLSAIQLFPGIAESAETVRAGGVPYNFASMFSFPPENLLTAVAPGIFGNMRGIPYWGRCYLWEMSVYLGCAATLLVVLGCWRGRGRFRWSMLAVAGALFILALGGHTPLFKLLYRFVPGFDVFRGNSKFAFPMSLCLIVVASIGLESIRQAPANLRRLAGIAAAAALITLVAAGYIYLSVVHGGADSWWADCIRAIRHTKESYLLFAEPPKAAFITETGVHASRSLAVAGGVFLVLAVLCFQKRFSSLALWGVVLIGITEVLVFARLNRPTFPLTSVVPYRVERILEDHPAGSNRVLNLINPNISMSTGVRDLWGYDPGVPRRYAEFIAVTQGGTPSDASQYAQFTRIPPVYSMLRCQYAIVPAGREINYVPLPTPPLPRLLPVRDYRVIADKGKRLTALTDPGFDPAATVILERAPRPAPGVTPGTADVVRVDNESVDHLTIEAEVDTAALLVVTSTYGRSWRAVALPGSAQSRYRVMPANHTLLAVPLAPGQHHLRLEYCPVSFAWGMWVTGCTLVVFAGLAGAFVWLKQRPSANIESTLKSQNPRLAPCPGPL